MTDNSQQDKPVPHSLEACLTALGDLAWRKNEPFSEADFGFDEISDSNRLCKNPLVSVFMIVYNSADFVETGIKSVLEQQTSFPFELIISDDGSSDQTIAICQDWQQRYPETIRILKAHRNLGIIGNRARAQKAARAPWIALMDGDDFWISSCKLQKQIDLLNATGAVLCMTFMDIRCPDGTIEHQQSPRVPFVSPHCFLRNYFQTSTYVYSREALAEAFLQCPNLHGVDDVDLFFCLSSQGKVALLQEPTVIYNRNPQSECLRRKGNRNFLWTRWQFLRLFMYGPRCYKKLLLIPTINAIRTHWQLNLDLTTYENTVLRQVVFLSWFRAPFSWSGTREWLIAIIYSILYRLRRHKRMS